MSTNHHCDPKSNTINTTTTLTFHSDSSNNNCQEKEIITNQTMPPQSVPQQITMNEKNDIPDLNSPCSTESSISLNHYYKQNLTNHEEEEEGEGEATLALFDIPNHEAYESCRQLTNKNNIDGINNEDAESNQNFVVNHEYSKNDNNYINNIVVSKPQHEENDINQIEEAHDHQPLLLMKPLPQKGNNKDSNDNDSKKEFRAETQMNQYLNNIGVRQRKVLDDFYTAAVENPCKTWKCTNPLQVWQSCDLLFLNNTLNNDDINTSIDDSNYNDHDIKPSISNISSTSYYDPFNRNIVGPKSCEYCFATSTQKCCEKSCGRPKLFFKRKEKPFKNDKRQLF